MNQKPSHCFRPEPHTLKEAVLASHQQDWIAFIDEFWAMKEELSIGLSGFYVSYDELSSKNIRTFTYCGAMYAVQKMEANLYRVVGYPVCVIYDDLIAHIKNIISIGMHISLGEREAELVSPYKPVIWDNYMYNVDSLLEYNSKSYRKDRNKLDKLYTHACIVNSQAGPPIVEQVQELCNKWADLKGGGDYDNHSPLSENGLLSGLQFLILIRDGAGVLVAYSLFEKIGAVVLSIHGKSIIEGISTFRWLTIMKAQYYKSYGVKEFWLGAASKVDASGTPLSAIGLSQSKQSLPHTRILETHSSIDAKKFRSIEDTGASTLF